MQLDSSCWRVLNFKSKRQDNFGFIFPHCPQFYLYLYLGVLQGVGGRMVRGGSGEGVLVAVPAQCHEEFGKGNTFHKYHVIYIQKYQSAWLAGTPCPWEDEEGEVARM